MLSYSDKAYIRFNVRPALTVDAQFPQHRSQLTKEKLIADTLYMCQYQHQRKPLTKQKAVQVALFGIPLWMVFLRFALKRAAIWAWKELTKWEA